MLEELGKTPFEGVGKPEPLKHQLAGYWSREINKKDRLIYRVEENIVTVFVVSAMGHYSDK
ncbi:Txe/YoeB family addiction module toxin [Flavobacterium sp. ZS1P14]|uniref:Txe/YoeB family addiction module toxin n=1 Tax=Flavobacterium sp. ZS1P14 TaxID=3401729 RepID=UPI003AB0DB42